MTTTNDKTVPESESSGTPTEPSTQSFDETEAIKAASQARAAAPGPIPYGFDTAKRVYRADRADAVMALAAVVLGYLWWNWLWPRSGLVHSADGYWFKTYQPAIAVTAFFALALTCSLIYFSYRKVLVAPSAIVGIVGLMLAALPFAFYDTTPVHLFAGMGLLVGYITWHAHATGTAMSRYIGGLTGADVVNQTLVVPFINLGVWFASLRALRQKGKKSHQWVFAIIGVIIALPVLAVVMALLMTADAHFGTWMSWLVDAFIKIDMGSFLWQLSLGVLVAIPLAGLLYGNTRRDGASPMTAEQVVGWGRNAHRVTNLAIATPIAILCLMYLVFFVATGSSLFVAFTARGAGPFAYAEYARSGFFQLVAVAAINLAVLAAARLFIQRDEGVYPHSARVLGVVMSAQTLLLVVTAASKLLLYIDQYGLTRLRLYTVWFCGVLFVVFALVGVWHVRRFAVGRPILIFVIVAFLGLFWANTDGMIANYNVDRYLNGRVSTIDVEFLNDELSAAAVPALVRLRDSAPDETVSRRVSEVLDRRLPDKKSEPVPWTAWNWQTERAKSLLAKR